MAPTQLTKHSLTLPNNALADKVIMVTGAGDGIGKEAAISYAKLGATVILVGRTTEKLEQVYDMIEQAGAPQPAIIPIDFEHLNEHNAQQIGEKIVEEFGRLDGLLHNASILGELTPIELYSESLWQKVMQVNLNACFLLTRFCLPALKAANAASIVFTSSGVGNNGRAFWGAYSVSKFATEGLAQVLADELDNTNIRVNTINPGATRTSMRAKAFPGEDPASIKLPAELMPLYCYLMSDHGQSINKQRINANDLI
ncbi:MAG: YciK family oxidoreductase [Kangiellaceae bacterium]|jgi:NAD(P)-dependent dehydrogenase (short-subunit alcohol dehydrogenase family)|nr:YciK family oxidoreductase [Kangiellaceae bacterium]